MQLKIKNYLIADHGTKVSLFKIEGSDLKFIGDFKIIIEAKYYIKNNKTRFQESLW